MLARTASLAVVSCLLASSRLRLPPAGRRRPLDPLNEKETATAFQVIEGSRELPATRSSRSCRPGAAESRGLALVAGPAVRREAFAQVYDRAANRLFEAVVDLGTKRLLLVRPGSRCPAGGLRRRDESADAAVRRDARWRWAMARRGLEPDDVSSTSGRRASWTCPRAPGVRLLRALHSSRGDLPNAYDRPIEACW